MTANYIDTFTDKSPINPSREQRRPFPYMTPNPFHAIEDQPASTPTISEPQRFDAMKVLW